MKHKANRLRLLSVLVCIVLIAATALMTSGCNGNHTPPESSGVPAEDIAVRGEGETQFYFTVVDAAGEKTHFDIRTDKSTVGDALLSLGLIAGDAGDYGLYVKTVNGVTLDYARDGKYWAFYADGAYATSGVDTTQITVGATYAFKAE